jgi:hypothetical protein
MLVPVPRAQPAGDRGAGVTAIGARSLRDAELLAWCEELVEAVFGGLPSRSSED